MLYLKKYIERLIILLIIYSTSRIYLYYNNIDSFYNVNINEFIEGIRFDISAILYINIPIFILMLLPLNIRINHYYQKIINLIFYITNIPFIILNNIDIEYFRFTQKRSTIDFFQLLQLGDDAKNTIPGYILEYWMITVFTIIQIFILLKIKEIPNYKSNISVKNITYSIMIFLLSTILFIVGARGGIQLKPINMINAGELTGSKNTSLILNTPFCILQSINGEPLIKHKYFDNKKIKNIYNTRKNSNGYNLKKMNIIILIMESYSKEFIGYYNNKGFTPFLDSLIEHSLVFTNAYANGIKSIEALPAITASIPTLMNNPFITSNYGQNNFQSIASLLNKEGYKTSFYHGGNKGTMGFYSFCKKANFTNYYGREEYNNDDDYDNMWGIYDEPFFQYFYNNLNKEKEPFFSTFFSLSSHTPYKLPDYYIKKMQIDKKNNIVETIRYADYSMSKFFNKAKKEPWFRNSIFIITADHTSPISYNKKYKNKIGRYAIPMIIFKGDSTIKGVNNNIVQQIDIMPTILELINYQKPHFSFGKSMFNNEDWSIHRISNEYKLITKTGITTNILEQYIEFSDWDLTKEKKPNQNNIRLLKAIKQTYNESLIKNNMVYEN